MVISLDFWESSAAAAGVTFSFEEIETLKSEQQPS